MTPEQLTTLRAACAKATPGPWNAQHSSIWKPYVSSSYSCGLTAITALGSPGYGIPCVIPFSWSDVEFIALARTALPQLLDEVERLRRVAHAAHEVVQTYVGGRAPDEVAPVLLDLKAALAGMPT